MTWRLVCQLASASCVSFSHRPENRSQVLAGARGVKIWAAWIRRSAASFPCGDRADIVVPCPHPAQDYACPQAEMRHKNAISGIRRQVLLQRTIGESEDAVVKFRFKIAAGEAVNRSACHVSAPGVVCVPGDPGDRMPPTPVWRWLEQGRGRPVHWSFPVDWSNA